MSCAIINPTRTKFSVFIGLLLLGLSIEVVSPFSTIAPSFVPILVVASSRAARTAPPSEGRRGRRGHASVRSPSDPSDDDDGGGGVRRSTPPPPSGGRRGFVASCVVAAAAAICAASSAPPSNSITATTATTSSTDDDAGGANDGTSAGTTTDGVVVDSAVGSDSRRLLPVLSSSIIGEPMPEMTAFQESVSGFVSGSAVSIVKTIVKYPLDTVTVRLQMPNSRYGWHDLPTLLSGCFDGMTAPLVSNVPSAGVFFAIKDAAKSALTGSRLPGGGDLMPGWAITSLSVGSALPLYWAMRNPSEVIKTRLQVGAGGYHEGMSTVDAFRLAVSSGGGGGDGRGGDNPTKKSAMMDGISELYLGYGENIAYAYPADIIKFGVYEYLTGLGGEKNKGGTQRKTIAAVVSPADGAIYGALSTAISQFVTTPLDVLRNRIMAEVVVSSSSSSSADDDGDGDGDDDAGVVVVARPSYVDRLACIAREEGVGALFAGSAPRVAKALLSGAIQFATYEETKQKMSELFIKR